MQIKKGFDENDEKNGFFPFVQGRELFEEASHGSDGSKEAADE